MLLSDQKRLTNIFEGASSGPNATTGLYNSNNASTTNDPSAIGTAAGFGINTQNNISVSTEAPSTQGKQAGTQPLLDKSAGQQANIAEQKGAILGQIQDVKQQILSAVMDVAQGRGIRKGDTTASFSPRGQSTMVDAAIQVAGSSVGGPLVQAASLFLDVRSSIKGMNPDEARSVMREAMRKVDSANHYANHNVSHVQKVSTTKSFKSNDDEMSDAEIDKIIEFMQTPDEKFVEAYDEALTQLDIADDQILNVEEYFEEIIAAAIDNNDADTLAFIGENIAVAEPLTAGFTAAVGDDITDMSLPVAVVDLPSISEVQTTLESQAAPAFAQAAQNDGASSNAIKLDDPFPSDRGTAGTY